MQKAGPARGPQSRPLAPLSSPQSISPARDQTICPVSDFWVHRFKKVQSRVLGEAGREWRRERERMKRTLGKKRKRSEIAREHRGGFGGCTGRLVYWKGGEKVLRPMWKISGYFLLYDVTFSIATQEIINRCTEVPKLCWKKFRVVFSTI